MINNFDFQDDDELAALETELEDALGDSIRDYETVLLGHPTRYALQQRYWRDGELGVDTDTAGMIWVHPLGKPIDDNEDTDIESGIPYLVLNDGGLQDHETVFGTPVKIKRENNQKIVLGIAGDLGTEYYHGVNVRLQRSVDMNQFDFALIKPTNPPSNKFNFSGGSMIIDGTAYHPRPRTSIDVITPSSPSTGNAKYTLVEFDPVLDDFVFTIGSEFAFDSGTKTPQHEDITASRPSTINTSRILIGWIRIFNSMTQLLIDDILPIRGFLNKGGSGAAGVERGVIVTTEGEIVVDDDGGVVRYTDADGLFTLNEV